MWFEDSRRLFEAARDACEDIDRANRELEQVEARATAVGRPSLEPHGRDGGASDRVGERVAAAMDATARLEKRIERNFELVDVATGLLYGRDMHHGLATLMPAWVADALWWHYLAGTTWDDVAAMMGLSPRRVQGQARAAFELMDSLGMAKTVAGEGLAAD